VKTRQAVSVFGVSAIAFSLFRPFFFVCVDGGSMSPTYRSGELVTATRFITHLDRGDVVVFKHDDETCVKRIAFLPGDSFMQVKFLGDWIVPDTPRFNAALGHINLPQRRIVIPPHTLFVVGDRDHNSIDSRTYGPIPESDVIAQVVSARRPADGPIFPGATFADQGGWAEEFFSRPSLITDPKFAHIRHRYHVGSPVSAHA